MSEIEVYCDRGHPRVALARLRRREGVIRAPWECDQIDGLVRVQALEGDEYVAAAPTSAASGRRRSAAHPDRQRWRIECRACGAVVVLRADATLFGVLNQVSGEVDEVTLNGLEIVAGQAGAQRT